MRAIQDWFARVETAGARARFRVVYHPATDEEQARVGLAEPSDVHTAVVV